MSISKTSRGRALEVALSLMNRLGRIVACGMISQYNAVEPPPGPRNIILVVAKSLTLQAFIVSNYLDMVPSFFADMGQWIREGKIKWSETIVRRYRQRAKGFPGSLHRRQLRQDVGTAQTRWVS